MRNNYFLGFLLALIFPGLIQLYIGEKRKAITYMFIYLTSFIIIFLILSLTGYIIDVNNYDVLINDPLLINISFIINVVFRLLSGVDGFIQLRRIRKNYY